MGDNTHWIPDTHKDVKSPFYGVTLTGLSYEIVVETVRSRINTVEFANRMMDLRIQAAADARRQGRGFGQMRHISNEEVETQTQISLRVSAPGKIHNVKIEELGNGMYYAKQYFRRGNLRDVARGVMKDIDSVHGLKVPPKETPTVESARYSM